jgi:hypothetical protein
MSLDVVSKKIEVLARKPVIKAEDIDEVIVAAERSLKGRSDGVSNAEARAVADLYLRAKAPVASPKVQAPSLEDGAVSKLNAFFIAHQLPYGDNKLPMKERIQNALAERDKSGLGLGVEMARAPRTGSLQPLRLTKTDESVRKDAYVDAVKKQFVVKVMDGASEPKFYGPFALDPSAT